uniref:Uncharacterized protein n=1 Tax=Avena sativa TaxID=4498 RepID=A0ACD5W8Q5_AVESA
MHAAHHHKPDLAEDAEAAPQQATPSPPRNVTAAMRSACPRRRKPPPSPRRHHGRQASSTVALQTGIFVLVWRWKDTTHFASSVRLALTRIFVFASAVSGTTAEGEAAHAIVPQGFFQTFINSLHETRVYEFSRFRLIKKLEVLRPVDAEFAIVFTHLTTVGHRDDLIDVFPKRYYSLTPFSCLPSPTPDSGCLIDVLGAITAISDIKFFSIPNRRSPLLKRHVFLKDLSGHELKIVLWGNSALRFNGDTILALGQTKPTIAIFVGTTVQAYDGNKGLAAGAPCSWYINEDIADINSFLTSPSYVFQPVAHASLPHVISLNSQVGENWPRKTIAQLSAFNLFENQESKFRCSVTISRMASSQQWWYTGCNRCHRMARASMPPYADPHTFTCSDHVCPCTDATLVYWFSVIASDRTGEVEFTLFGSLATQMIGTPIQQVIECNQPDDIPVFNYEHAAEEVRFPPPEVSKILSCKYRFVVSVTEGSFHKMQPSFMVRKVEAVFPRIRRLSSIDTVIPATSWAVVPPAVPPSPSVHDPTAADHVSSTQALILPS